MQADRWQKIETLFHQALEQQPRQRAAFLATACGTDQELLREVESLLATHQQDGGVLADTASDLAAEWAKVNQQFSQQPKSSRTEKLKLQQFGPYQVVAKLGKGGMGDVYLAEDTRLRRKVALKLLPIELTTRKEWLRRFELEALAASATNHPNIITIYEIGKTDESHFIAAEYVEGKTLRQMIDAGRLEFSTAMDIAAQVASALSAAHAAGVYHRDIKPENIMVRPDGLAKVLDFGLAKQSKTPSLLTSSNATTVVEILTAPGTVVGTPQYMSPEQARGLAVDYRTDIFSLGVVLYEMLAGREAFTGDELIEVLASVAHREPESLKKLVPEIPHQLEKIVHRAMLKDRDRRFQTASELQLELKNLKQELELEARLKDRRGTSWIKRLFG
ncbi:MAG: serine/threonine-protein kinase [Acidobacteriota bacterium]|nr:serine/threonine-protein kinase [Acidobacteriota bacterium]